MLDTGFTEHLRKEEQPRPDLHGTSSTRGYRIAIEVDGPETILPGETVELNALAYDSSNFLIPVQIRWSLYADSVGKATLITMEDNRAILTVLSPEIITVRASVEEFHDLQALIQVEGKALPFVQNSPYLLL